MPHSSAPPDRPHPSFAEATRVWLRVALQSFGGPTGQVAVMHRILVDEQRWVSEERFMHALSYCMLLPGPEAQQLATYLGWLLHRTPGGLVAGVLFVAPGFLSILALSLLYTAYGDLLLVDGLFFGIKAAVLALVLEALLRIGRRALTSRAQLAIAGIAFVAIFAFAVPFPLIIAAAAAAGWIGTRAAPQWFTPPTAKADRSAAATSGAAAPLLDAHLDREIPEHARPSLGRFLRVTTICSSLWLAPIAGIVALTGWHSVWSQLAIFFSKLAVVTFGGAYAVLAYMAQQAVETHGWLSAGEMLDGLGLAETTPGPLIQVVQFVGYLAAYRDPGALQPWIAGTLAAVLTTWVTFVPCFLWIFAGAPYVEALRANQALKGALAAITAAVAGVVLNLAVWFSLHTVFAQVRELQVGPASLPWPELASIDLAAAAITLAAAVAALRMHVGMAKLIAAAAAAGLAWRVLGAAVG